MELVRSRATGTVTREGELCQCGLPTAAPIDLAWWQPEQDDDPGLRVRAVIRYGDQPELRRAERVGATGGWSEQGVMVDFYADRTPPMPWSRVGRCWAGTPHPVVAVREDGAGGWTVCG